jgi:hypothetical protein
MLEEISFVDQDESLFTSITPNHIGRKAISTRGLANCLGIVIWILHKNDNQNVLMQHFPALWENMKSGPDDQYTFLEIITNFIREQNEFDDICAITIIRLLNNREILDSAREIEQNNNTIQTSTYLENEYNTTYDNVKNTIKIAYLTLKLILKL